VNVSAEAWAVVGTGITTLGAVWISHLKTRQRVDRASRKVDQVSGDVEHVRELAEPTGNGFARRVTEALAELQRGQARIERRQETDGVVARKAAELLAEHLGDHARAEINRPDHH
jgi:hypothetical protein